MDLVFTWLVIYQGLLTKARLATSGLSDGICPSYLSVAFIMGFPFARPCWEHVQLEHGSILHGILHWCVVPLVDSRFVVQTSLSKIWNCLQISTLFILWKLPSKYLFENEVSSLVNFYHLQKEKICIKLLMKVFLFINNVKVLEVGVYLNFLAIITILKKYINFILCTFHFLFLNLNNI